MRLPASLVHPRTALAACAVLVVAGCGGGAVSPDKARTQPVAEAAGATLSGGTLDKWLLAAKEAPTRVEASGLVSAWINGTLLIDAIRKNTPLDDQATFDSVIMETAARTVVGEYFANRDRQMPAITDRQVDSILDIDQARVFQQIVVRIKGKVDSASVMALRARAQGIKKKLEGGADFSALVKQESDDTAGRSTNGYLPALTAAEMGPKLEPIFNLAPNAISPIVASPVSPAFIILRRATRPESRSGIKAWLAPRLARRADSLYMDSIARAKKIVIAADARLRVRAMAHEPVNLVDGPPFATWEGGTLTPAAVRNATLSLAPMDRFALTDAPDTVITQFLTGLARRDILLPIVVTEPLPTAAVRTRYLGPYKKVLDSLRAVVNRLPASLAPGDAAAMQVDSVLAQRAPFLQLPGALQAVLRARNPATLHQPVFDAVVRGAVPRWQVIHKDDSTTRTPGQAIKPAPGGAPAPGAVKTPQ
jgi:hypothetical protein